MKRIRKDLFRSIREERNGCVTGNKGKRLPAVYTVEAVLVMLISMAALFAVSFLAFYLHDRQSLEAEMGRLVRRASAENWTAERLKDEFQEGENCRLFYMRVQEVRVNGRTGMSEAEEGMGTASEAEATGVLQSAVRCLEVRISFPAPAFLQGWLEETKRTGWISQSASPYRPAEFIRKTEALKGVLE